MKCKSIVKDNIVICQPEEGFRFSVDSVYLAWFVRAKPGSRLADVGSGSGVIAALLAEMRDFGRIEAVEMQGEMFECLLDTIRNNNHSEIVFPFNSDIREFRPEELYDAVVCNPPYRDPDSGRVPANEVELNARFTTTMSVYDVFKFCKSSLKNSGRLYLSYDADMLQDLFEAAVQNGFEAKRLMPVCPDINVKPKIVLAEFRKNTGREMSFEPPLYQKINGVQSEQERKIMTGDWSD